MKWMLSPRHLARIGVAAALWASAAQPAFADAGSAQLAGYDGTLGQTKISLYLLLDNGKVSGGHYFYNKYLKDIPLKVQAGAQPGEVLLQEDHGAFHLKLVGPADAPQPLDFDHSNGLRGEWTDGKKTLPVQLSGASGGQAPQPDHWYGMISDETDAVFEARVQGFYFAVLKGDAAAAARYVSFPLRVNFSANQHVMIKDAKALKAQWQKVFTPNYLAALRDAPPHELAVVKSQYAMLGQGLAYFTGHGAAVLNTAP